jgi:hypothetical protein
MTGGALDRDPATAGGADQQRGFDLERTAEAGNVVGHRGKFRLEKL